MANEIKVTAPSIQLQQAAAVNKVYAIPQPLVNVISSMTNPIGPLTNTVVTSTGSIHSGTEIPSINGKTATDVRKVQA